MKQFSFVFLIVLFFVDGILTAQTQEDHYRAYLTELNSISPKTSSYTPKDAKDQKNNESHTTPSNAKESEDVNGHVPSKKDEVASNHVGNNNAPKINEEKIDHKVFGMLLKKHVSADGKVNYRAFKKDEAILDKYLNALQHNEPVQQNMDALAFWINAYNAFTIKLILKNYPLKSIMDLHQGKTWDQRWIKIGDRLLSLNSIEHDIIRPVFKEPRIHFAVNCAAKSCPPLLNDAYYGHSLNKQLEQQTKQFINNKAFNEFGTRNAKISKIFEWYGSDFPDLKGFLSKYTNVDLSRAKIEFAPYNWALNQ